MASVLFDVPRLSLAGESGRTDELEGGSEQAQRDPLASAFDTDGDGHSSAPMERAMSLTIYFTMCMGQRHGPPYLDGEVATGWLDFVSGYCRGAQAHVERVVVEFDGEAISQGSLDELSDGYNLDPPDEATVMQMLALATSESDRG